MVIKMEGGRANTVVKMGEGGANSGQDKGGAANGDQVGERGLMVDKVGEGTANGGQNGSGMG